MTNRTIKDARIICRDLKNAGYDIEIVDHDHDGREHMIHMMAKHRNDPIRTMMVKIDVGDLREIDISLWRDLLDI